MMGKASSIGHGSTAIDYARLKEDSLELDKKFIISKEGKDIIKEFKLASPNQELKNNTISVVLSPHPKDGANKPISFFKELIKDYIKDMKMENHQYVAYLHNDVKPTRPHIHIYINRKDLNGKTYKDGQISIRTNKIADDLAIKHNLIRAKIIGENNEVIRKHIKSELKSIHSDVLKHKPKSLNEYKKLMQEEGVGVKEVKNKQGNTQGLRYSFKDSSFKGSEIDRKMSFGKLTQEISENQSQSIGLKMGRR